MEMTQIKPFVIETLCNRLFDSILTNEDLDNILYMMREGLLLQGFSHTTEQAICRDYANKYMERMIHGETVHLGDADRRYTCGYIICILCRVLREE